MFSNMSLWHRIYGHSCSFDFIFLSQYNFLMKYSKKKYIKIKEKACKKKEEKLFAKKLQKQSSSQIFIFKIKC